MQRRTCSKSSGRMCAANGTTNGARNNLLATKAAICARKSAPLQVRSRRMGFWRIAVAALLLFGSRLSLSAEEKPSATARSTEAPVMKVQVEASPSEDSKDRVLAFSKLIVELLPAFAWPVLVGLALWWFRFPVGNILEAIAHWIPNAKGFEFG